MKVLFIQIGDIHIEEANNSFPTKKAQFFDAVKNYAKDADHVFLVITGDIAFSGSKKEYEFAIKFITTFIDKLSNYSGKEIQIISVPGNHDCENLVVQNKAREGLIKLIQNNGSDTIDDSVLDVCTSAQINYREFYDHFEDKTKIIHQNKLITIYEYNLLGKNIIFYCYNTAYMSVLHEQPGKMLMPISIFPEQYFNKKADLAISIYHHPLNWNNPNNRREFLYQLQKTTDLHLTGHEHFYSKSHTDDLKDNHIYCIESDVLQETGVPNVSGFNVFMFNLTTPNFYVKNFKWNGLIYSSDEIENTWHDFERGTPKIKKKFEVSNFFKCFLQDPGANFTHRNKPNVTLSDIFIYPAIRLLNYSDVNDSNTKLELIESEPIIKSLKSKFQILFIGDENIGKTAFLKTIYGQLNEMLFVPVYIDGHSINSANIDELSKHINKAFVQQYSNDFLEDFLQLDSDKIVLIVDDFDKSNLKVKYRAKLLKSMKSHFANFIITASDLYQFEEMVSEESSEGDLYESLTQYEIQEFGWRLQNRLINKWNTLGVEELISDETRIRNNEDAHQIIKTVIGKNFIPKYPVFLLTILQSIEGGNPLDLQTSSFGHYYYYLIIKTLKAIVPNPSDLTTYINFISELAFYFYSKKVKTIDERTFIEFHRQYKIDYSIVDTHKEILTNLIKANIIENFEGNYEFKYIYQYYFFVAKNLGDNIKNADIKNIIKNLCERLHILENANIIIFLTHHSKDDFILDQVLDNAKKVFSDFEPAKLQNDIDSINMLSDSLPKLIIKSLNIDQNRDEYFGEMDEKEIEQDNKKNNNTTEVETVNNATDELDLVAQLNSSFKHIEILGQILKNNHGQIKTPRKIELVEEAYGSGLRSLNLFFKIINENTDYFINQIVTLVNPEKIPDRDEIEKMSKKLLFSFCNQISYNFIRKISDSLGSEKLEEILSKIPEKYNYNSYRLIDFSIKLDHYKGFPEFAMMENAKIMRNNPLAFQIVRRLVWRHLHLYPTNYQQKQKISDILQITMPATFLAQSRLKK